jgi:uncharacterized protein (DUF362 family)
MNTTHRRDFIKKAVLGSIATATGISGAFGGSFSFPEGSDRTSTRVSLMHGNDRADLAYKALRPYADMVKKAIGSKKIIIKPNNVHTNKQLASTHVDTLEGILEFLKSIGKTQNLVIAESAANGPTFDGYENYGYFRLVKKYKVELVDLDKNAFEVVYVFNEKDFQPHPVRTSSLLLDQNAYIISAARLKTHDRVVATLSLKNIVFGAPIKDIGFNWGPDRKEGTKNDKPIAHGDGFRAINYNTFSLAYKLHPHLALIDGFEGMEGNGPTNGTPVDHRICVASTDWLAADRVAVELMGVDFNNVGYLNYCYNAGMGEADLRKIEIVGERLADHIRNYKLSDNYEKQLVWKNKT